MRVIMKSSVSLVALMAVIALPALAQSRAVPVPGYVPPLTASQAPDYVDDTRGVFVPEHMQQRLKTEDELARYGEDLAAARKPLYTQGSRGVGYEKAMNTMANGTPDATSELERIAGDPGMLAGGGYAPAAGTDMRPIGYSQDIQLAQAPDLGNYPSLATGGKRTAPAAAAPDFAASSDMPRADGGVEMAVGQPNMGSSPMMGKALDMQNSIVRLKEERVAVRRVLQRMLDQIGGNAWTVVYDLDEQNAGLPDMEISIVAEEPFMNVLNALLGRLQTRSGAPLRVIRYDQTQRLVLTDRTGDSARAPVNGAGVAQAGAAAITETVLKEARVSLHYDEVPLVDALENVINQAGKGQWRLRMYAGSDQVLKPAHIEEPFGVALERILKVFNLRYEVFPGGKLIVVTGGDSFGFRKAE
jgi:hypothetical protein